jgi:hypothetical protein
VVVAIKKSDLYGSLWRSCDELRGGMDASQYKDYIVTMLFVTVSAFARVSEFGPLQGIYVLDGGFPFPRRSCARHSFDSPAETNLTFRRQVLTRVRLGIGGQDEVDQRSGRR